MGDSSGRLDYWRKCFRSVSSDIFELIEKTIQVAAVDFPVEFKARRGQIAEKLFTSRFPRCFGCNHFALQGTEDGGNVREEECRSVKRDVGEKDSKVDCSNRGPENLSRVGVSNCNYDEAEAFTQVKEEERKIVGEVLRIKEVLLNNQEESEAVLYASLRRLQLMRLSVETLKETEVGKAVNGLRKHNSKQIRDFVRTLIGGWKVMVFELVKATSSIADNSTVNTSVECEEEGLPSPPMDEGALWFSQSTIELSEKIFDGMDEDNNFKAPRDFNKARDTGRVTTKSYREVVGVPPKPPRKSTIIEEKKHMRNQEIVVGEEKPHLVAGVPTKPQGIVIRLSKQSTASYSVTVIPSKSSFDERSSSLLFDVQRQPSNAKTPQVKPKIFEKASDMVKLEIAKRKLHEGYQRIENAKRQRKIKVLELHDLPKQWQNERPLKMKPRNQSRSWSKAH